MGGGDLSLSLSLSLTLTLSDCAWVEVTGLVTSAGEPSSYPYPYPTPTRTPR